MFHIDWTIADTGGDHPNVDKMEEGWGEWLWSMVPQILPEMNTGMEDVGDEFINDNPCTHCVGFYLRDGSILYKVTVHVSFTIYITILHYAISLYIYIAIYQR